MNGYDTVLFDSDGILVEPPAHETQLEATRAAFQAVGIEDTDQQHLVDIVNGVTIDRLHEICAVYDLDPDAFWKARENHDERSQLDKFRDGSRDCYTDVTAISHLSQNCDVVCGVVSNNHHSTIEFVLEHFDLQQSFDTYYGREKTIDSLDLKKPNPHYLERALADLDAESALYVGDSESDVVAANRAGVDSVFVRRSHCRDVELTAAPTYDVTDLHGVTAIVDN